MEGRNSIVLIAIPLLAGLLILSSPPGRAQSPAHQSTGADWAADNRTNVTPPASAVTPPLHNSRYSLSIELATTHSGSGVSCAHHYRSHHCQAAHDALVMEIGDDAG